jgi:hypothetical protein
MLQKGTNHQPYAHYRSSGAENCKPLGLFNGNGNNLKSVYQSLKTSSRVVMSGPCIFKDPRKPLLKCLCPAGQYDTPASSDTVCKECDHLLIEHQSVSHHVVFDSYPSHNPLLNSNLPPLIKDPMRSLREDTVTKLWRRVQQYHVVHVRGTLGSGKSTLSHLLRQQVKKIEPGLPILWCSWPVNLPENIGHGHNRVLSHMFDIHPDIQINWLTQRALLIIDEAQGSYICTSLWNDFIKYLGTHDPPMIILFSSWGSATSRSEAVSATPIHLADAQRISIRPSHNSDPSVFFTYTEFIDVIERVKQYESQYGQAFLPNQDVINYIWAITNGHPGTVRAILTILAKSEDIRPFRKGSSIITLDAALLVLGKDTKLVSNLTSHPVFKRGLPPIEILTERPDVVEALRNVLLYNRIKGIWKFNDTQLYQANLSIDYCYRQGWLQAELAETGNEYGGAKTVYIFPSVLHRR